jgi:hypothetical protein
MSQQDKEHDPQDAVAEADAQAARSSSENHAAWSRKLERELYSTNPDHYDKFFRMTPDEAADEVAREGQ